MPGTKGVNRGESIDPPQIEHQVTGPIALPEHPDRHPDKEVAASGSLMYDAVFEILRYAVYCYYSLAVAGSHVRALIDAMPR